MLLQVAGAARFADAVQVVESVQTEAVRAGLQVAAAVQGGAIVLDGSCATLRENAELMRIYLGMS